MAFSQLPMCGLFVWTASVLLAYLGNVDAFGTSEYSRISNGCFLIFGVVGCESLANYSLPGATVTLWERDTTSFEDKLAHSAIVDGEFKLAGCDEDGGIGQYNLEVYLEFNDVCKEGDSHHGAYVKPDAVTFYKLRDEQEDAEMEGLYVVKNSDKCFLNAGLSQGCDMDEMMKIKLLVSFKCCFRFSGFFYPFVLLIKHFSTFSRNKNCLPPPDQENNVWLSSGCN